jgi:ATPase family AAA domain-containing protein 1
MPKKFPVPLPGAEQRLRILQLVLGDTKRDKDFDLNYIAKVTAGMSGSDIKEACRDAAMVIRTEDFFGRQGGGQLLMENHRRRANSSAAKSKLQTDSSTGYIEEEEPASLPLD